LSLHVTIDNQPCTNEKLFDILQDQNFFLKKGPCDVYQTKQI